MRRDGRGSRCLSLFAARDPPARQDAPTMPIAEITRAETSERARLLRVDSYDVTLDLTRGDEVFGSASVIRFGCREPGATSYVDLIAAGVHEITLNGAPVDVAGAVQGAQGRITLPPPPAGAGPARARGEQRVALPADAADLDLPERRGRRRVPARAGVAHHAEGPDGPARRRLPGVARRSPGRRRDLRDHPARSGLLYRAVPGRLPVRQVRPGLRARLQRGRHRERRLRGHLRRTAVPVPGHQRAARAAGDGDLA